MPTDLLPFEQHLLRAWPAEHWRQRHLLLAVSGGADSVALLRAMHRLWQFTPGSGRLIVAHFNHALRGAASDADQQFVQSLAAELDLPCEVGTRDPSATFDTAGNGLEAAARQLRYQFMRATAEQLAARYLVTAHTADDQAETVLHHVIRGSGLAGLGGIRRVRTLGAVVSLVRPLLGVRRQQVLDYLAQLNQPHCHDLTNNDRELTRNRIRHDLLPRLAADFSPGVVDSLLRLGTLAAEAQSVIDGLVTGLVERHVRFEMEPRDVPQREFANRVWIDCGPLASQPRYLIRELLVAIWKRQAWPRQSMGFEQWESLAGMVIDRAAAPSARDFPGAVTAQQIGERLSLARRL